MLQPCWRLLRVCPYNRRCRVRHNQLRRYGRRNHVRVTASTLLPMGAATTPTLAAVAGAITSTGVVVCATAVAGGCLDARAIAIARKYLLEESPPIYLTVKPVFEKVLARS